MDCTVGNVTEEALEVGAQRSTAWILQQKSKKGAPGRRRTLQQGMSSY